MSIRDLFLNKSYRPQTLNSSLYIYYIYILYIYIFFLHRSMLTNIFCLLSRIVKSHWYWCCINSWYVDIEPILVTNKWVIRLSCKPPKHQFQMVPPPVNSVPDVELWYWEDIPAQCQAPATLTADRPSPGRLQIGMLKMGPPDTGCSLHWLSVGHCA